MRVAAAVFGVGRYADPELDSGANRLEFAAEDALSFASYARAAWSTAVELTVECRTDEGATAAEWTSAVRRAAAFGPDLFVAYLAGHGVVLDDERAGFCFSDAREGKGVLHAEGLDLALSQIGADSTILLLDCCYAEGVVRGGSFFGSLQGSDARVFLCSARGDQKAWEDSSIRHGLFSNALIRGLASTSAIAGTDGYVDVDALSASVGAEVARRAFALKGGARQEPVCGGMKASAVRLPTAASAVLGGQISTYQAATRSFRRWLLRSALLLAGAVTVSDLSFQHLVIGAEDDVLLRSGLPVVNSVRRLLPGGIVDTGIDRAQVDTERVPDASALRALQGEGLLTQSLPLSRAWPGKLAPLLRPGARRELAVLQHGEQDVTSEEEALVGEPPLEAYVASLALSGATQSSGAVALASEFARPAFELRCDEDTARAIDLSILTPTFSDRFIRELDWRLVAAPESGDLASRFGEALRIVAYRHVHYAASEGTSPVGYEAIREFARLAEWAGSTRYRSGLAVRPNPGTWCALAETLIAALSRDRRVAEAAEAVLLAEVFKHDPVETGDALAIGPATSLGLLGVVAQHRRLDAKTVDSISSFVWDDERGLGGMPEIGDWLADAAPLVPFPASTREFLFAELPGPVDSDGGFRHLRAFEILGRNSQYLDAREREILEGWAQGKFDEWRHFDPYVSGVAHLVGFLPKDFVREFTLTLRGRTDSRWVLEPPLETWRGEMLIAPSDLPEWLAIWRVAQSLRLDEQSEDELIAEAAAFDSEEVRQEAVLAVARQLEVIRSGDWRGLRRRLAGFPADSGRRDVLTEAAGLRICSAPAGERKTLADEVLEVWSTESVPILRLEFARVLQHAALCGLVD